MSGAMMNEERERMTVRTIRVTLASALRHATPDQAQRCKTRARQLIGHARSQTTAPAVVAEIAALEAELDGVVLSQHEGEA